MHGIDVYLIPHESRPIKTLSMRSEKHRQQAVFSVQFSSILYTLKSIHINRAEAGKKSARNDRSFVVTVTCWADDVIRRP